MKSNPFENLLGELTFLRTYSKIKEDGRKETWKDTVERYFTFIKKRVNITL